MRYFLLLAGLLAHTALAQPKPHQQQLIQGIEAQRSRYAAAAQQIWEYAEVGYQEVQSAKLLQGLLQEAGFNIQAGVAEIPTAFVASYGSGQPVIAILGEYDALPGISQDAKPTPTPIAGKKAGHACGHHLFGVASAAAAIAVKEWMQANKIAGTLRFYGTPAEEGGSGKVYMVRAGLFTDVSAVLHWHPNNKNSAQYGSSMANINGKFRFQGIASHAAASPERGRSALDGVEAMNAMVNMLREHTQQDTRIHYVITRGGEAPNVVPAQAEVYYYVRHPNRDEVRALWQRVIKAAEGAAMGTETKVSYEVLGGVHELLPNVALARVMDANLRLVGGYRYTAAEEKFAQEIQRSLTGTVPSLNNTNEILPFGQDYERMGSTDVGDISWVVPTVGLGTATWVPGTPAHSWQAVAAGGTSIGTQGMMMAAKSLALTAADLFQQPATIAAAWEELKKKQGATFKYEALLGNRPPALDYRK